MQVLKSASRAMGVRAQAKKTAVVSGSKRTRGWFGGEGG
jgi:hypothetical protein